MLIFNQINMKENDVIFKLYGNDDHPDPDCFCHFGWEGIGSFAFWKYACAYYDCAEILFERFKESKGNYAILDGIGLPICFSYRHFIELSLKFFSLGLFVPMNKSTRVIWKMAMTLMAYGKV